MFSKRVIGQKIRLTLPQYHKTYLNIKNYNIQNLFEYQKQRYSKVIWISKTTIFKSYFDIKKYNIQNLFEYEKLQYSKVKQILFFDKTVFIFIWFQFSKERESCEEQECISWK